MNLLNEFTILFLLYPKQTIQFTQQLRIFYVIHICIYQLNNNNK